MAKHTLYAYVEGSDLAEVEQQLLRAFESFVTSRSWICKGACVVNQRRLEDDSLRPGDLPDWDLGLNIDLPDAGKEGSGWFSDVTAIAKFLGSLHSQTGRDFVMGIGVNDSGISEDLFDVASATPDLNKLKAVIGVGDTE